MAEPSVPGHLRSGEPVLRGIAKRRVREARLALGTLGLEGDRQADLRVHGGPDKAVYAYPAEHPPSWNAGLGADFGPAAFGESLTTAG